MIPQIFWILSEYLIFRIFLYGGSHGAFISIHLAADHPESFKAVVARNPVTNKATKSQASDIPDNGMLVDVNTSGIPLPKSMSTLFNASPITRVSEIETPIYLMVGKQDKRVPPSQAISFYHEMKGLGKGDLIKMNVYDDCHPLPKPSVHMNVMINTALFYNNIC